MSKFLAFRDSLTKLGLHLSLTKYSSGLIPFLIKQKLAKEIRVVYDGEGHAFEPQWELSMQRSVEFFQKNL